MAGGSPAGGRLVAQQHQPSTKTIVVYRNGDGFFPGRKIVVNRRQLVTFDTLLTLLTGAMEAPFGAVRRVFTTREGREVADLEALQHGERYVAAGSERFKRLNVFTNGEVFVPPARVMIPKYTLTSWEKVLAMVTEKVDLRTGAVHRLYTLDGHPLQGPADLRNNQYYVAVGADKFRAQSYSQWVPCRALIRENHVAQGVFNAKNKREEMAGAAEVQEDCQLKVDLPIDQVEAREVEEEFEHGRLAVGPPGENKGRLRGSPGSGGLPAGHRGDVRVFCVPCRRMP
ncbi:unnamed protein product [Merluccius merluccius]